MHAVMFNTAFAAGTVIGPLTVGAATTRYYTFTQCAANVSVVHLCRDLCIVLGFRVTPVVLIASAGPAMILGQMTLASDQYGFIVEDQNNLLDQPE